MDNNHNEVLISLRRITRAIDLHSKRLAKETGLTSPQILVLNAVAAHGFARPSEIAKQIHLSQATITSIVDRLEKAGLATRERAANDKRSIDVVITDLGRQRLKNAPEPLQSGFLQAFNQLDSWEQSMLVAAVQRLASMMDADQIEAAPILELGELDEPSVKLED